VRRVSFAALKRGARREQRVWYCYPPASIETMGVTLALTKTRRPKGNTRRSSRAVRYSGRTTQPTVGNRSVAGRSLDLDQGVTFHDRRSSAWPTLLLNGSPAVLDTSTPVFANFTHQLASGSVIAKGAGGSFPRRVSDSIRARAAHGRLRRARRVDATEEPGVSESDRRTAPVLPAVLPGDDVARRTSYRRVGDGRQTSRGGWCPRRFAGQGTSVVGNTWRRRGAGQSNPGTDGSQ